MEPYKEDNSVADPAEERSEEPFLSDVQLAEANYYYMTDIRAWQCFGITIKKCFLKQSLPDIAFYQQIIHELCVKDGVEIEEVNYEVDSTGLLHLHAILYLHPKVYRKGLKPRGCHMHLDRIESNFSLKCWFRYITKDQDVPDKEQLQTLYKSGSLF